MKLWKTKALTEISLSYGPERHLAPRQILFELEIQIHTASLHGFEMPPVSDRICELLLEL